MVEVDKKEQKRLAKEQKKKEKLARKEEKKALKLQKKLARKNKGVNPVFETPVIPNEEKEFKEIIEEKVSASKEEKVDVVEEKKEENIVDKKAVKASKNPTAKKEPNIKAEETAVEKKAAKAPKTATIKKDKISKETKKVSNIKEEPEGQHEVESEVVVNEEIEGKKVKPEFRVYHLSKRASDNKWQVKFAGGEKVIKLFDTKKEAMEFASKMAVNQDGAVLVHASKGKNKGKIRSK